MSEKHEPATEQCGHEDCDLSLADRHVYQRPGGETYCSSEHLLAAANENPLDEEGDVIKDTSPIPSAHGADITVVIPTFSCPHCTSDSERIARENSEWVHHVCGMQIPDHYVETANDLLESGEFDRGIVKQQAEAMAERARPYLDDKEGSDDGN